MFQKHRIENRHRQRVITRPVQTAAPQSGQAHQNHIAQIAAVNLHHLPLAHVTRPVEIPVVDHVENRNENNNEKIHN